MGNRGLTATVIACRCSSGIVGDVHQSQRFTSAAHALDVNDQPFADVDHLECLAPARRDREGHQRLVAVARLDREGRRRRWRDRPNLVPLSLENRPGLVATMSIRVLLSEPSVRNSAPVHVVVQHLRERVDVTGRQYGVGLPYPTQIGVVHSSESSRNSDATARRASARRVSRRSSGSPARPYESEWSCAAHRDRRWRRWSPARRPATRS